MEYLENEERCPFPQIHEDRIEHASIGMPSDVLLYDHPTEAGSVVFER